MKLRKVAFVSVFVLVLIVFQVPNAISSETNENEELYEFLSSESPSYSTFFGFLSDVVELDLTKYGVIPPETVPPGFEGLSPLEFFKQISEHVSTLPPPNITLPDKYGGLVEEEVLNHDFGYSGTRFGTMAFFVDGHMSSLKLSYYGDEDFVYSKPQPTGIVGRSKAILQRYRTFFQVTYGRDAQYIEAMLDMLNSNDDLSLTEFTEGNVTFRFSQDGNQSRFDWIYTEGDVEIDPKVLSIDFRNNAFESFHDTWGLYSFSGLNTVSHEEAVKIVVEAAQKGELRRSYSDPGTGYVNFSELVDTQYSVSLMMVTFRFDDYSFPSRISRDPLTIYPLFHIYFYFNLSLERSSGLVLFVWGDTGEIRSCTDVGKGFYYNGPMYDTNDLLADDQPTEESSFEEQSQKETTQFSILNPLILAAAVSAVAVPVAVISVFLLKRKNGKDKHS